MSVFIPTVMFVYALSAGSQPSCKTEGPYLSYAPMIWSCGAPTGAQVVVGWSSAVIMGAGIVVAIVMSAVAVVRSFPGGRRGLQRWTGLILACTTAGVLTVLIVSLTINPELLLDSGMWLFSATIGANVVTALGVLVWLAVVAASLSRQGPPPNASGG